jgi:hypothetical protein
MLSHIDMSASDMLLAFSLAMVLQRMQRKQLQDQQEERRRAGGAAGAAAAAGGDGAVDESGAVAAAPAGVEAAVLVDAGAGQHRLLLPRHSPQPQLLPLNGGGGGGGIQLSAQSSPGGPSSVCSADELLIGKGVSDLEAGLLGKRRSFLMGRHSALGSSSGSGSHQPPHQQAVAAAATPEELRRTESFLPARLVGQDSSSSGRGRCLGGGGGTGDLQLGAEKAGAAPAGGPQPGDSRAGEQEGVDADTLTEAAWAMKYAFASYGVLLFIFSQPT